CGLILNRSVLATSELPMFSALREFAVFAVMALSPMCAISELAVGEGCALGIQLFGVYRHIDDFLVIGNGADVAEHHRANSGATRVLLVWVYVEQAMQTC